MLSWNFLVFLSNEKNELPLQGAISETTTCCPNIEETIQREPSWVHFSVLSENSFCFFRSSASIVVPSNISKVLFH